LCTAEQEGKVQLRDGRTPYEGRVEVCSGGEWGTICNLQWGNEEARVVCQQLGFQKTGKLLSMNISSICWGSVHILS